MKKTKPKPTHKTVKNKKNTRPKKAPKEEPLPWYDPDDPAAKLVRFADKKCLPIRYVVERFPAELKRQKIKPTDKVITRALALERQWDAWAKNLVWKLGGTYNGIRRQDEHTERKPKTKLQLLLEAIESGTKMSAALQR